MIISYPEAGRIINVHGFRGVVKAESWCDSPKVLAGLKTVYLKKDGAFCPVRVLAASVQKQFVLLTLEGVDSEEKANALRQTVLYAARDEILPGGKGHLLAELIGLPVRDADSSLPLGTLKDVLETAGGLVYAVTSTDGKEVLVPAVPAFVIREDPLDAVYLRPIPGMFTGEEEE